MNRLLKALIVLLLLASVTAFIVATDHGTGIEAVLFLSIATVCFGALAFAPVERN